MIAKITTGGRSFKGAFQYYLHDKGQSTSRRVAWTHTENLLTDDPHKAWRVMAYTCKEQERLKEASGQKMTGRKLTKPVFAYSLSWHPEQQPGREHMLETAQKSIDALGLAEHEIVIIAHRDEPQQHVHILINRVHPLTGLASDTGHSKLKLSDFSRRYEHDHGKIYCPQREINHSKREQGEKTMYRDQVIVEAWKQSDNGKGFAAALKDKGYQLAQGRKRLVVIDRYGQTHNPTRHLENVRAKDFTERVRDLDLGHLPEADLLSKTIQTNNRRRYDQSLRHDEWAAGQKNVLQTRQQEQRAEEAARHETRLTQERVQLEEHYRLKEQQDRIDELRRKTLNPSWWKRLLRFDRKEQTRLTELELTRQNAQSRMQERLSQVERDRQNSLTQLKEQQAAEKRQELERIQTEKPRDYVNEDERQKIIQFLRDKREERSRNGPSMER